MNCKWELTRCQADDMWYCETHGYTDGNNDNLGTTPTVQCPTALIEELRQKVNELVEERDRLANEVEGLKRVFITSRNQQKVAALVTERDLARAEVERLKERCKSAEGLLREYDANAASWVARVEASERRAEAAEARAQKAEVRVKELDAEAQEWAEAGANSIEDRDEELKEAEARASEAEKLLAEIRGGKLVERIDVLLKRGEK